MSFLRLPYTRAALAEIQRFADITPSGGVGHKVLCDVEFHGYTLPKVMEKLIVPIRYFELIFIFGYN